MTKLDQVLRMAVQARASDLHVASGEQFIVRQFGKLKKIKSPKLTPEATRSLIYDILTHNQRTLLEQNLQLDFGYEIKGLARFRGNVIMQRRGMDASFRIVPLNIPSFQEAGLPDVVKRFCDFHQGLILVTGATGQGKSTTLAVMVDYINSTRPEHIITVEDPIEFVHPVKVGVVNQRQLGSHTRSFPNALRAALRQDPDVIMVGELRDLESIRLAITASETGHLVLGTLATSSGPKTVDRLIDSFPSDEQNQIRSMLAESLRGVVTQRLLPTANGDGLVLAAEIMIGTVPLSNLIRTEKTHQIPSIMQTGKHIGMQSMDDAIIALVRSGKITAQTAQDHADSRRRVAQAAQPREGR